MQTIMLDDSMDCRERALIKSTQKKKKKKRREKYIQLNEQKSESTILSARGIRFGRTLCSRERNMMKRSTALMYLF